MRPHKNRRVGHRFGHRVQQTAAPAVVLLAQGEGESLEALAQRVRQRGAYQQVEVALADTEAKGLREAVSRAASGGASHVVVVPVRPIYGGRDGQHKAQIERLRAQFPSLEIALAGPLLDLDGYADLVVHQVHQHDPGQRLDRALEITLEGLPLGAVGRVRDLHGGQDFLARMAALGFTPGAEVSMVQNFGHGPVIVALRGTRIALGRGEAGKVHIWKETQ
jgi:ferrous iron transport protein A